jgi:hypothetical protein
MLAEMKQASVGAQRVLLQQSGIGKLSLGNLREATKPAMSLAVLRGLNQSMGICRFCTC